MHFVRLVIQVEIFCLQQNKHQGMLLKSSLLFSKSLIVRVNNKRNTYIYDMKFSGYIPKLSIFRYLLLLLL